MSSITSNAPGPGADQPPPPAPLTISALHAHDRATSQGSPSRLAMPTGSSGHGLSTPTQHLRNTSYFPITPKPIPQPTKRARLTPGQSKAHALGYAPETAGAPPVQLNNLPASPLQQPHLLQTIPEATSSIGSGSLRSGSGGNPAPSFSSSKRRATLPTLKTVLPPPSFLATSMSATSTFTPPSGRGSKPNTKTHPYFLWTPGSGPPPSQTIYDPDYPEGTPSCISPRTRSTPATTGSNAEHSKDYFSKPIKRNSSKTSRRGEQESPDAAYPPPRFGSPRSPAAAQSNITESSSASASPSPPTSTKFDPSMGEISRRRRSADFMSRSFSEMTSSKGYLGSVDDIFGHITSVRPDGTHADGVIPWSDMPKYVAKARRDALEREKKAYELDQRLKKRREEREEAAMAMTRGPRGKMIESEWIPLSAIEPPSPELLVEAAAEQPEHAAYGQRSRSDSGETFLTALEDQEQVQDAHETADGDRPPLEDWPDSSDSLQTVVDPDPVVVGIGLGLGKLDVSDDGVK